MTNNDRQFVESVTNWRLDIDTQTLKCRDVIRAIKNSKAGTKADTFKNGQNAAIEAINLLAKSSN